MSGSAVRTRRAAAARHRVLVSPEAISISSSEESCALHGELTRRAVRRTDERVEGRRAEPREVVVERARGDPALVRREQDRGDDGGISALGSPAKSFARLSANLGDVIGRANGERGGRDRLWAGGEKPCRALAQETVGMRARENEQKRRRVRIASDLLPRPSRRRDVAVGAPGLESTRVQPKPDARRPPLEHGGRIRVVGSVRLRCDGDERPKAALGFLDGGLDVTVVRCAATQPPQQRVNPAEQRQRSRFRATNTRKSCSAVGSSSS
jgi:hypothetical protein